MKKKSITRLVAFILSWLILILSLSSCSLEETVPEPTDELVLYTNWYNHDIMANAISQFQQQYPEVNVVVENYTGQENHQEYITTLQTELSAGTGPDLILYMSGEIADLFKSGQSGVFADINPYIEADPDFDLSGYNDIVLNSGIIDEKRYFVPLSYNIQNVVTTKENLEYFNVNLTESSSFTEIATELVAFCKQNKDNADIDWINYLFQKMGQFFPWSGVELVNYETKEVMVDTEEFKQLMELYKEIYPMDWVRYSNKEASTTSVVSSDPADLVNHRYLLVEQTYLPSYLSYYAELLDISEQTPFRFNFGINKTVAKPTTYAAINNSGNNRYNAYLFLKILLGFESQTQNTVQNNIPVLQEAVSPRINEILKGFQLSSSDNVFAQNILTEIIDQTEDITVNQGFSYQMQEFVWEHMEPYFKDEKDYESCLAELENKLQLYLNE